jgi:acid phosphatase type 7
MLFNLYERLVQITRSAILPFHSETSKLLRGSHLRIPRHRMPRLLSLAIGLSVALSLPSALAGRTSSGTITRELSRGGAGLYHDGSGPCGVDSRGLACIFHVSTVALPGDDRRAAPPLPSVSLAVSNASIAQLDRVKVTASFQGHTPTPQDWVGVYCVDDEDAPPSYDQYIDYQEIRMTTAAEQPPPKEIQLMFGPLVNMRCSWQFRYFTQRLGDTHVQLATSEFVRYEKGRLDPLHIHLAKTEKNNEIRVHWVSTAPPNRNKPFVQYGFLRDQLTKTENATTSDTYHASDMCEAPATTVAANMYRDPGVMFSAVLSNLEVATTYYYRVCSDETSCSSVLRMRTPPAPGSQNGVASFFVYGDLGDWTVHATGPFNANRSGSTMDLIRNDMNDPLANYVAVMHNGDLSYGKGSTFLWDQFGALIEPVASEIPYMVGIGNHEYCYESGGANDPSGAGATNGFHPLEGNYGRDSNGECGVPTNKRFIMPNNGNNVFWWSTEMGLTHQTQISSEHDYTPGSVMYKWLENDLKSVDREKTPWLFLHLHRPLYTSEAFASDNKVSLFMRKQLEPLLAKYKVDAVFSGHYHAYELTCPVYNGTCRSEPLPGTGFAKARAPVHIMVGSAGADIDAVDYYDVPWRVDAQLEYGYGRVHVHNASHAKFEFVRNRDEIVASSAWIISDHDWSVEG